jgi:hypothetical protein
MRAPTDLALADLALSPQAPDAPTQRILIVAEAISQYGPITLPELTLRLGFSRGAIWRAIDTLRARGWVRMRAGDSAFEIEFARAQSLANAHCSNPELGQFMSLFQRLARVEHAHVDLGQFVDKGVFRIVESTRKAAYSAPPLSLVDDDLAITAQLSLSPQVLVGHLRAFIVNATEEERRVVTSGAHGRTIAKLREAGQIWMADQSAVCLTLAEAPGFAIRAELWRITKADIARLAATVEDIIAARGAVQHQDFAQPASYVHPPPYTADRSEKFPSSATNT